VHGLLHLSGLDHPEGHVDDSPMGDLQKKILNKLPAELRKSLVVDF